MGDPVLEARGLRKRSRTSRPSAASTSIVGRGERVGLLGPNGAGKTTTLLMLLGAITPDAGTIDDRRLMLPRERSKAMAKVGFAAGYLPLPDRLKVREALGVFAGWYGVRRPQAPQSPGRWNASASPTSADRLCSELSSGSAHARRHRQGHAARAGAARARRADGVARPRRRPEGAARPPRALLRATGAALLVTSHDMREVEMLTERVIFLARGEVVANDTPRSIASDVRPRRPGGRVPRPRRDASDR